MTGQPGVIYMLHFDRAVPARPALHRLDRGPARPPGRHASVHGARLVAVIWQAGIGFTLVRICEGTRHTERAIKNAGGAVRYSPACTPGRATAWGHAPITPSPPQLAGRR